jgi:hypothetical protein
VFEEPVIVKNIVEVPVNGHVLPLLNPLKITKSPGIALSDPLTELEKK